MSVLRDSRSPIDSFTAALARIIVPSMSQESMEMAIKRFSARGRLGFTRYFIPDLIRSIIRLPFAVIYTLVRAGRPAAHERADVLLYCGDADHYERRLRPLHEELSGLKVVRAGRGLDAPSMTAASFLPGDAVRFAAGMLLVGPLAIIVSLVSGRNYLKAIIRACTTFMAARWYFMAHPARVFLTYEENNCSPPVYDAFHASGGEGFFAFQNGIWLDEEGLDHSRADRLFSVGTEWIRRHARIGSRFGANTVIGPYMLGAFPSLLANNSRITQDVLFIDQGAPEAGAQHWGIVGPESGARFLEFVARFAREHPEVACAYQLRCYGEEGRAIESAVRRRLESAPLSILGGCEPMKAYRSILASRVVVTIHSTLGIEALALGKPALFFNFTSRPDFNIVEGPLQSLDPDYEVFESKILGALEGRIGLGDVDVLRYTGTSSFRAPATIASEVRQLLGAAA